MKPRDPASFIYKYVLPPPRCPTTTPVEAESIADGMATLINPLELISRLEKMSRHGRPHAPTFSWGPDEAASSKPTGVHFGDDYQEHCSEDCPLRVENEAPRLSMEEFDATPGRTSISSRSPTPCLSAPFSPSESKYPGSISSSLCSSPQSDFQVCHTRNDSLDFCTELATIHRGSWRSHFQERQRKQKLNRMSLDFILSTESRYPSLPNIMPHSPRDYALHLKGPPVRRPRLPSLKETVGYLLTH